MILTRLKRISRRFAIGRKAKQTEDRLTRLSDRSLKDIGLSRDEIRFRAYEEAKRNVN